MGKRLVQSGLPKAVIYMLSAVSIAIIVFIFIFIFYKAWPVLRASGLSLVTTGGFDRQIPAAFAATEPLYSFGLLGLILGSVLTTLFSMIVAGVIGVGAAITICEYTSKRVANVFIAIVRLLASMPSVIFGLVGMIVVVPFVRSAFITDQMQNDFIKYFQMTGRSMLAAVIVLSFMIVPTIVSLSVDAIRAVPNAYKETGYAFGMKKFRVISRIVLPAARPGIIAGFVLGAGRGIGEAIAVSMVCGGIGVLPQLSFGLYNLLAPTLPLAAAIINKSEAMGAGSVEAALFSCAAMLLLLGAILSIGARLVNRRMRKAAGYDD